MMLKRLISVFLALFMLVSLAVPSLASENGTRAVYLGVKDYGMPLPGNNKDNLTYIFAVGNAISEVRVDSANEYALNNLLMEGYVYDITVSGGVLTGATLVESDGDDGAWGILSVTDGTVTVGGKEISAGTFFLIDVGVVAGSADVVPVNPVDLLAEEDAIVIVKAYKSGTIAYLRLTGLPFSSPFEEPEYGKRTLKSFLLNAMQPVGTTLYLLGGGWNWQNTAAGPEMSTLGVSPAWADFFRSQDADFQYRDLSDFTKSYYPHRGYNEYHYAGLDPAAYISWTIYQTLETQNNKPDYTYQATQIARALDRNHGFGTFTMARGQNFGPESFSPGDIYSMNGFAWIVVGVCDDGSILALHTAPSSGVQFTGIENKAGTSNNALKLARKYMALFPEWTERYGEPEGREWNNYVTVDATLPVGKFSWSNETLDDPDDYKKKTPEQIVNDLLGAIIMIPYDDDRNLTHDFRPGDNMNINTRFVQDTPANVVTLSFTWDAELFELDSFVADDGIMNVSYQDEEGSNKLVVMLAKKNPIGHYSMENLGDLILKAKPTATIAEDGVVIFEQSSVTVKAIWVIEHYDEDGKLIIIDGEPSKSEETASYKLGLNYVIGFFQEALQAPPYRLKDLSYVTDWFGENPNENDWKVQFDKLDVGHLLDTDGTINITLICYIAKHVPF